MNATKRHAIAPCSPADVPAIFEIINQSAVAYKGVIPADTWHEPYMAMAELQAELVRGVRFHGCRADGQLVGVMGIEDVQDVTLIRHAYIRPEYRRHGMGGMLLEALRQMTDRPVLIGTWRAATWAVGFYEKHGFTLIEDPERKQLLQRYWTVSERQKEVAVVLADARWRKRNRR